MKWMRRKRTWICLLILLSIAVLFFSFSHYRSALQQDYVQNACRALEELTEQHRFNLYSRWDADLHSMETMAQTVQYLPTTLGQAQKLADSFEPGNGLENVLFVDTNGRGVSEDGVAVNLSKEPSFTAAMQGKTGVYAPEPAVQDGQTAFRFSTPILQGTEKIGVLAASYQPDDLAYLISAPYGERSYSILIDAQGRILYQDGPDTFLTPNSNLLDTLVQSVFTGYDDVSVLQENMQKQLRGHSRVTLQNEPFLLHYEPLEMNGWYLFSLVPEKLISSRATDISEGSNLLTFVIFLLFSLLGLYALSLEKSGAEEKRARLADLERAAYYDPLTGLPNFTKFKIEAKKWLSSHSEHRYMLLKFDICNFKAVNEMFGFSVGDTVICAVAECLPHVREALGLPPCLFARINADEFILLDRIDEISVPSSVHAALLSEMLSDRLSDILGAHRIEFRYGRYRIASNEERLGKTLEKVNMAHRMTKSKQMSVACDYDETFRAKVLQDAEMENQMHAALETGEFIVYLQAKYELAHETVVGAEALVRWRKEDGTLIPPNDFIPLFERNGFILQLDRYVFGEVCHLLQKRLERDLPIVTVSVNFSRLHLSNPRFVQDLLDITTRYGIPTHYIEIELTESIIFDHADALYQLLNELHRAGFSLSMDDFGSGYSSLGLLKDLPVDVIKMDATFFGNSMYKTRAKLLIESVMQLARDLKIKTVAEGVEEEEQIHYLREVGCDIVQGYYYARPLPPEGFFRLLDAPIPRAVRSPTELLPLTPSEDMPELQNFQEEVPLSLYRTFIFTLRVTAEHRYGTEAMENLLRTCGHMAGYSIAKKMLDTSLEPDAFLKELSLLFQEAKIAILDLDEVNWETWTLRLVVREDLGCSGMSPGGDTVCQYDEGIIAGILHAYTKKQFQVIETDCWATGAELCRFDIRPKT